MMKILFAVLLLVCVVAASGIDKQFEDFKKTYNKEYKSPIEEEMRKDVFKNNLIEAKRLTEESKGKTQYGVTKFSDLTKEEFSHMYLMKIHTASEVAEGPSLEITEKPDENMTWDWRYVHRASGKDGYASSCISAVYNQGQCGSCWAFSATEQIESMYCLQGHSGGVATHLSMTQIVDCDKTAYGCDGGWTYSAYKYVESAGGLDSLSSYPYVARDEACKFKAADRVATITSWAYVGKGNEADMLSYVQKTGPLSICVDASSWSSYTGGVILGSQCGKQIDHCVQATGYTADKDGQKAWIVRNSWGTSWGYSGYLYVQYGQDTCGLTSCPSTVVTKPAA